MSKTITFLSDKTINTKQQKIQDLLKQLDALLKVSKEMDCYGHNLEIVENYLDDIVSDVQFGINEEVDERLAQKRRDNPDMSVYGWSQPSDNF